MVKLWISRYNAPRTMPAPTPRVGIDFGTSSSALAVADAAGQVRFAQLPTLGALGPSWRTLLFFDPEEQQVQLPIQYAAGGEAIAAYLECMGEGRLVQSFKTHLTTASLGRTQIAHHAIGLEDMISLYLQRLRQRAEAIVFVLWQADGECADDFKSFKSCPSVTVLIRRKAAYQIVATCAY